MTTQKISFAGEDFDGCGVIEYESLESPSRTGKLIRKNTLGASLMESPKDAIINEVIEDENPEYGVPQTEDSNTPIMTQLNLGLN